MPASTRWWGTRALRRIVAALIDEVRAARVETAPLRGVQLGLVVAGLKMPTLLVRLLARAQLKMDPAARSSMCEDLQRGRPTEVDYLNGEIVRLATRRRDGAAERADRRAGPRRRTRRPGSPRMTAGALYEILTA